MALTKSLKEIISDDKTGLLEKHQTWERVCLGEVADVLNGFPFESRLFHPSDGTPLIRIRDVVIGRTETFYNGEFESQFLVDPGDLLVGMDGDFNCSRWRSAQGLLNQRVCKITPNERFFSGRLLELTLPGYLTAINAQTSSVTVKHLSSRSIEEIELPLPPLGEQMRIVEKLEELLSDLDAGVAELRAAQKKLAQYRQSLLKAAVEGSLTADWRKNQAGAAFESGAELLARVLRERRARWEARQLAKFKEQGKTPPKDWQVKYPPPIAPDVNGLPASPEGWVWASLDQLSEFITSGSRGWADYYAEQGATFIRSQNINKDWLDLSDIAFVNPPPSSEGARTLVRTGDLLLTITGANVGKSARVDIDVEEAYVSQHVALIRLIDAGLGAYLHLFLTADTGGRGQLSKEAYGAGKPGLNLQQVGSVAVPLPGEQELAALMQAVSVQFRATRAQAIAIAHGLKQCAAQRKNILQEAFSGKLVPQEPADEPASVLLERIRIERGARAADATPRRRAVNRT